MNFTEEVGDALYDALVASINRSDSAQEQNGAKLRRSNRRLDALSMRRIQQDLLIPCGCKRQCNTQFSAHDVLMWRQKIHKESQGAKRNTVLIDVIRQCSTSYGHVKHQLFKVHEKIVCRHAFIHLLLRVSVASFSRAKNYIATNMAYIERPVRTKRTNAYKGEIIKGFIREFVQSCCDHEPDKSRYRMPAGMTRTDLFRTSKTRHPSEHLRKSAFFQILRENFKDVTFSKHQRFTKCTTCSNFQTLIDKQVNIDERKDIIECRHLHLMEQQLEREAYYVRRAQAETKPKQILSLIIDGMDQKKTNLPHYANWINPDGAGAYKLKTHVVGSLVHGRGKFFFVDYNQYPHDTNLVLSCLLRILQRVSQEQTNSLPATLYVQLDNTCRENKNKYFLGFAAYLVKKGYIKEVWISFLIVGHTHEDVDQTFSKISHRLKKNSALTLEHLLKEIQESQQSSNNIGQTKPVTECLDHVWDISGWLDDYVNQVHNVTYPHVYRLSDNGEGHIQIQFKYLSTDEFWRPQVGEDILEIFKLDYDGQQILPPGTPDLVNPSFKDDNYIQLLSRSLQKDFTHAAFTTPIVNFWKDFLEKPLPDPTEVPVWPLSGLGPYHDIPLMPTLTEKERELLTKFAEKQHEYKRVYTSQRRRQNRGGADQTS